METRDTQTGHHVKWIEWNWIVSIWKHMSQIKIIVDMEHMWTFTPVRLHDISLMEAALSYNFSPQTNAGFTFRSSL
jgi:hypothetical protein